METTKKNLNNCVQSKKKLTLQSQEQLKQAQEQLKQAQEQLKQAQEQFKQEQAIKEALEKENQALKQKRRVPTKAAQPPTASTSTTTGGPNTQSLAQPPVVPPQVAASAQQPPAQPTPAAASLQPVVFVQPQPQMVSNIQPTTAPVVQDALVAPEVQPANPTPQLLSSATPIQPVEQPTQVPLQTEEPSQILPLEDTTDKKKIETAEPMETEPQVPEKPTSARTTIFHYTKKRKADTITPTTNESSALPSETNETPLKKGGPIKLQRNQESSTPEPNNNNTSK